MHEEMIRDYNVYEPDDREKTDFIFISWICFSALFYIFYKSGAVVFTAVIPALLSLKLYRKYKAGKRKELLIAQFQDLLYSISASVSSGRDIKEALCEGKENLKLLYETDTPMIKELSIMERRMREFNESGEALLYDLGKRSGVKDIAEFAEVYGTAVKTGADIVKVTCTASRVLLDKIKALEDIKSYTAQKKFEGRIIALMLPALVIFLDTVSPEYLKPLYETGEGRVIMTMALAVTFAGYIAAEKITDIGIWNDKKDKRSF